MGTRFIRPEDLKIGRIVKTFENGIRLSEPRVILSEEKKVSRKPKEVKKAQKRPQCKATKRDSNRCTAQSCEGHEFCKRHIVKLST